MSRLKILTALFFGLLFLGLLIVFSPFRENLMGYISSQKILDHNRILLKRNRRRVERHKEFFQKKQELLFPQAWVLSDRVREYMQRVEDAREEYDVFQAHQPASPVSPIMLRRILAFTNQINLLSGYRFEIQPEVDIPPSTDTSAKKEYIDRISVLEQEMYDAQREFLLMQGLYFFYQEQINILETRLKDDEKAFQNSYQNRLEKQNKYFPFSWPIVPSLGISAGYMDPSYFLRFGVEHKGIDIPTNEPEEIHAIAGGVVLRVNRSCRFSYVKVKHKEGYETLYGHVQDFRVKKGEVISRGQVVALTGGVPGTCGSEQSTGSHLHLEAWKKGKRIDPLYLFDYSLLPSERVPPDFDLRRYFSQIAFEDFDGDGVVNAFEYALQTNPYEYDSRENDAIPFRAYDLFFDLAKIPL